MSDNTAVETAADRIADESALGIDGLPVDPALIAESAGLDESSVTSADHTTSRTTSRRNRWSYSASVRIGASAS